MFKKILSGLTIGFMILSLMGCSASKKISPEDAIKKVVQDNITAMNEENLDKYMATIDMNSSVAENTRDMLKNLFSVYDLKSEIQDIKVKNLTDTTADVECVQITKKINGPEFMNNKISILHHMKKINGEWKFSTSEVLNTEAIQ